MYFMSLFFGKLDQVSILTEGDRQDFDLKWIEIF